MDMRSLNTSLPSTSTDSPRKQETPAPEALSLASAFKEAALSVTNLYRTAAAERAGGHSDGYQSCLEDLLKFLDRENLGVGDGEGWRIRRWATERHHGLTPSHPEESDEETEEEKRPRSSSPEPQRKMSQENLQPEQPTASDALPPSSAPTETPEPESRRTPLPTTIPASPFTFRSQVSFPTQTDMEMDMSDSQTPNQNATRGPIRLDVHPRNSRSSNHRNTNRNHGRQRGDMISLGLGAGTKRKTPFLDFFDISGPKPDRDRDGPDGGAPKRSRHS
ncbi:hypothetical protein K402DRAFT_390776 [Aulographum hederae CBS 113979]|uniref:Uncharacterized protein n=1 Tax=Aulographum hederae CBS 113979 TaxID=1176131 RepID=A0A6G1H995_9PEZI|nr:hypothetical protein K402DRAFT_390776 [Aulographum hederae CBS 113979]